MLLFPQFIKYKTIELLWNLDITLVQHVRHKNKCNALIEKKRGRQFQKCKQIAHQMIIREVIGLYMFDIHSITLYEN